MNLELIFQYLPQLLLSIITTVELMVFALLVGFLLSLLLTLCSVSGVRFLKIPVELFVFFIRGTPLLVQIFIIYYGSGQFDWIRHSIFWDVLKSPFSCAVIALALNTAGYTTELFKGAIKGIPRGELDACKALGMSSWLMLRRVMIPRALRIALPAYSNEVIMVLKGTSLASTITLLDLTGMTRQIISQTYSPIEFFLFAGIIYLLLNSVIITAFRVIERYKLHIN